MKMKRLKKIIFFKPIVPTHQVIKIGPKAPPIKPPETKDVTVFEL